MPTTVAWILSKLFIFPMHAQAIQQSMDALAQEHPFKHFEHQALMEETS